MKIFYTICKILVLSVFFIISIINTHDVRFFYLPTLSIDIPLIVALLGSFVIGSVIGLLVPFGRLLALRRENKRLNREIKKYTHNSAVEQPPHQTPTPNQH